MVFKKYNQLKPPKCGVTSPDPTFDWRRDLFVFSSRWINFVCSDDYRIRDRLSPRIRRLF